MGYWDDENKYRIPCYDNVRKEFYWEDTGKTINKEDIENVPEKIINIDLSKIRDSKGRFQSIEKNGDIIWDKILAALREKGEKI